MERNNERTNLTRRNFLKTAGFTGLVATSASLVGCGGTSSTGSTDSGASVTKTLNVAAQTAVMALDPILAGDAISMGIITNTVEGLFVVDADGQIQNGLCKDYTVSDDQLTYTFNLRDGLKWSNGDTVTANDFIYGWQRNASGTGEAAQFQYQIEMAAIKNYEAVLAGEKTVTQLGCTAKDDKTIVVELEHPVAYLLDLLAFTPWAPVNQKFCEEKGSSFGITKDDMIYCGAFTLTDYDSSGNTITITKNPDYWDAGNVALDVVNFQVISDTQQAVMAYENGTVDYVELTGDLVAQYADNEAFSNGEGIYNYYLMMNTKVPGLDNLNLRQAFAYGIDRDDICGNVLKDGSQAVNQMTMRGLCSNSAGDDFAEASGQYFAFDEDKAKELWAKATAETDKRDVTILYDQEKDFAQNSCVFIQSAFQKMFDGLTVNLESTPKKNRLQREEDHDYEIIFHAWGPDYADPTAILAMYESTHPSNYSQWSNEDFDKTYEKANSTDSGDATARWEDLIHCNDVCTEQAVCIPVFQTGAAALTRPGVTGLTNHITGIKCFYKFCDKS